MLHKALKTLASKNLPGNQAVQRGAVRIQCPTFYHRPGTSKGFKTMSYMVCIDI